MNKMEKQIILEGYKTILEIHIEGIDKIDSIKEYRILLNKLGLINERIKIENKVIAKVNNLLPSEIDIYDLLIDTLYNYHCIANYTEVEEYFSLLKYDLNKEELMYAERRLNYLKSHGKLELKPFI